jgi:hypothetical protein
MRANRPVFRKKLTVHRQGCQMVSFQTKNTSLGNFWSVLHRKRLVYFMEIWSILWTFGIFCGNLVYIYRFGMLYQEKSGNPAHRATRKSAPPLASPPTWKKAATPGNAKDSNGFIHSVAISRQQATAGWPDWEKIFPFGEKLCEIDRDNWS